MLKLTLIRHGERSASSLYIIDKLEWRLPCPCSTDNLRREPRDPFGQKPQQLTLQP